MPVVTHFEVVESKGKLQPTKVKARVKIIRPQDAPPIVQIDTGAAEGAEFPGKLSQTIQLTRERAIELRRILGDIYGL
jgi:hypothetical protein